MDSGLNAARKEAEAALEAKQKTIAEKIKNERLERERIDVTLPGKDALCGERASLDEGLQRDKGYFYKDGIYGHGGAGN